MDFGLGGLARAITLPTHRKRDIRDIVCEQTDEQRPREER